MTGVSVDCLKKITFSLLPLSEKLDIITRGRPTPNIVLQTSGVNQAKKYLKNFNHNWYEKIEWLCGCESTNALFCFPCLLFGGDTVWTQNGFTKVSKMKEKTGKHQNSRRHMANMISLTVLSQTNVSEQLSESSEKSHKQVKEYGQELLKIIDCLKFGGIFKLALQSEHNEFFSKLENFASKFDAALRNHILIFGKTGESLQNDLLQHVLEVCREEIVSEIQEASYVSVICEDVSNISENIQTIIVFRYELQGDVHEHFWGFLNTETVRRDGLSNCVLKEINKVLSMKDSNKLIAQTFSGPAKINWRDIQSVYHNAHFVHNFSSDLDQTLKHTTSSINSVRLFFASLENLDEFLKQPYIRTAVLSKCINGKIPLIKNFDVCTVYNIKSNLIKCFEKMLSSKTTDKTFEGLTRFLSLLKNENFLFWLEIFNKIILHFELFCQDIQAVGLDEVPKTVYQFCMLINKICNSENFESAGSSKILECQEVSNCICKEIKERFSFTGHLAAVRLFDRENFEMFHLDLPMLEIKETCQAYPDINEGKFIRELKAFYSQNKFRTLGILSILNSLKSDCLSDKFSETIKLLKILIVSPTVLTDSSECFTTIKKVKSCINNTVNEKGLSALCMLSVENEMVSEIKNFNERVLKKYCSDRKLEFY